MRVVGKIRSGSEAVDVSVSETEVAIRYGPDGISATIYLDWDEAQELLLVLGEAIMEKRGRVQTARGYETVRKS